MEPASVDPFEDDSVELAQAEEALPYPDKGASLPATPASDDATSAADVKIGTGETIATTDTMELSWPSEGCAGGEFSHVEKPPCVPFNGPVLKHTAIYHGTDPDVTDALKSYVYYRDDARFGSWQAYLQRSDEFLRFCCHKHIAEMLSARGGSRKTRVVWRWPDNR